MKSPKPIAAFRRFLESLEFPTPPWQGTSELRPITSGSELAAVAVKFDNCLVDRYENYELYSIRNNTRYFYQWSGHEEAFIELVRFNDIGWFARTALGIGNQTLTKRTLTDIVRAFEPAECVCSSRLTVRSRIYPSSWFWNEIARGGGMMIKQSVQSEEAMYPKISIQTAGTSTSGGTSKSRSVNDPDFEIIRIFADVSIEVDANLSPMRRFIIYDESLGLKLWPNSVLLISTDIASIESITEALERIMRGDLIIGMGVADLLEMMWGVSLSGSENEWPCFLNGRAKALAYNCHRVPESAALLRHGCLQMADQGYDYAVLIVELISSKDESRFQLIEFDAFATEVTGTGTFHKALVTAASGSTHSSLIAVGFQRPAAGASSLG